MTLIAGCEKAIPTFSWMINNRCNYHCTYCCADELNISEKINTKQERRIIRLVIARLKLIDFEYNLEILGGEPLLSKHIDFIISEVQKIESRTSENTFIITNLSKRVELVHSLNNITIKASYHPEYDLDSFFKRLKDISSKTLVIMNIHPDPIYHRKTKERIAELLKLSIPYELNYLTPIESIGFKSNYSDDIIKVFEKELVDAVNPSYFISFATGSNRFENKQCRPMFIDIDYNGKFKNNCTKEKYKLKISKEDLLISTCRLKFCECTLMLEYPKYND